MTALALLTQQDTFSIGVVIELTPIPSPFSIQENNKYRVKFNNISTEGKKTESKGST
jgi:hypothetical protein